jgi:hypothetical protein
MIALYMDDIPAAGNDAAWLTSFKAQLGSRFKIKDMGDLCYSVLYSILVAVARACRCLRRMLSFSFSVL